MWCDVTPGWKAGEPGTRITKAVKEINPHIEEYFCKECGYKKIIRE